MKTGAAYIRVSTDDQLEFSPDSQLNKIKEYAKSNDIILSNEFVFMEDEGRSGRNANKRPEFQRMISIAKTTPKPFDVILVWKFSRFARNREDSVVFKSMLRKKCGIDVVSVSEPVGDDKTSVLMEAIIEAMDEYYSVNLAEEVKRGMTEKAKRGGVISSPPFGYKMQDNIFVQDIEQAQIVQMVFNKFVNDDMGFRDIAVMLNAMGIRTKRGGQIENRTIEYMLHNVVYIGKVKWKPTKQASRDYNLEDAIVSDGQHEPIISNELFELAQQKLTERKKLFAKYARQSIKPDDFMLKGIVRCHSCGSTLVLSKKGLQCYSYAHGTCKVSHYISLPTAESMVLDLIENSFKNDNFVLTPRAAVENSKEFDVNILIQREHTKLDRIKAAYEDGIDTIEEYKQNKIKIMQTIENLQQSIKKETKTESVEDIRKNFIKKHKNTVNDLRNSNISNAQKNLIIRSFVSNIIFNRTKSKFDILYYV